MALPQTHQYIDVKQGEASKRPVGEVADMIGYGNTDDRNIGQLTPDALCLGLENTAALRNSFYQDLL